MKLIKVEGFEETAGANFLTVESAQAAIQEALSSKTRRVSTKSDTESKTCSSFFDQNRRQKEVIAHWSNGPHFQGCIDARNALYALHKDGKTYRSNPLTFNTTMADWRNYDRVWSTNVTQCKLQERTAFAAQLLSQERFNGAVKWTGTLRVPGAKTSYCSAVQVGAKVITARHCLINKSFGANFMRYDGTVHPLKLKLENLVAEPENSRQSPDHAIKHDVVTLSFQNPEAAGNSPIATAEAELGDSLFVVSMNFFKQQRRLIDRELNRPVSSPDPNTNKPAPFVDIMPTCVVASQEDGYFYHSCYTDKKASGAPLFRYGEDRSIELVGIQSGFVGELDTACARRWRGTFPNLGVSPFQ